MIVFPLHTILRLLGNESKVHLFPTIVFQEMLPTRVKAHLARFLMIGHLREHYPWMRAIARQFSPRSLTGPEA